MQLRGMAMELKASAKSRIVALNEEMDAIHHANNLYWKGGSVRTLAARAEYQFRNDRLEKIRDELVRLRSS